MGFEIIEGVVAVDNATSAGSYGQVQVAATATLILAAKTTRRSCLVFNNGSATIYVGRDSSVTTSTGVPIVAGAAYVENLLSGPYTGTLYGICASGTVDTRFEENG